MLALHTHTHTHTHTHNPCLFSVTETERGAVLALLKRSNVSLGSAVGAQIVLVSKCLGPSDRGSQSTSSTMERVGVMERRTAECRSGLSGAHMRVTSVFGLWKDNKVQL